MGNLKIQMSSKFYSKINFEELNSIFQPGKCLGFSVKKRESDHFNHSLFFFRSKFTVY